VKELGRDRGNPDDPEHPYRGGPVNVPHEVRHLAQRGPDQAADVSCFICAHTAPYA
jgi:hypothetical protein